MIEKTFSALSMTLFKLNYPNNYRRELEVSFTFTFNHLTERKSKFITRFTHRILDIIG